MISPLPRATKRPKRASANGSSANGSSANGGSAIVNGVNGSSAHAHDGSVNGSSVNGNGVNGNGVNGNGGKLLPALVGPISDRLLVDRCLAGDPEAWDEIYRAFHPGLVGTIRALLGREAAGQGDLVEEIAARVWHLVIDRGRHLLAAFDAERGCRLVTYLGALADTEILQFIRAERRQRARDVQAGRSLVDHGENSAWSLAAEMREFLATLSPSERRFCEEYLLSTNGDADRDGYSATNVWQLRHRVRRKLERFISVDEPNGDTAGAKGGT